MRLKEDLTCMEESDSFDFEKDPDALVISGNDCMLHQHETEP